MDESLQKGESSNGFIQLNFESHVLFMISLK